MEHSDFFLSLTIFQELLLFTFQIQLQLLQFLLSSSLLISKLDLYVHLSFSFLRVKSFHGRKEILLGDETLFPFAAEKFFLGLVFSAEFLQFLCLL